MWTAVEAFRSFVGKLRQLVWAQLAKRTPSENAFLILVPIVGAGTGAASILIAHLISYLQSKWWGSSGILLEISLTVPWQTKLIILTLGGIVVGCLGWLTRTETRGGGTSSIIHALALRGGAISARQTLPRVLAGIVTVACGGSLGREGPMSQFASAYGSYLGRRCKLSTPHLRILVCCAGASAIAAVYNAPIGGALFALEILIGSFALEVFGPVVVASVISTLIFRGFMGDIPRFVIPHYELISAWELIAYFGLGILGGLASIAFRRVLFWTEDLFQKLPMPAFVKPALGFALVAGIGIWYPHVFGNGYDAVNRTLHEQLPLTLLLILPVAKMVATAITAGSGGAGGLFTPSLMVGALLGGAFGYGVHAWFPAQTAEHGAYALVGMGAVLAGTTHAPLTAMVMIFEQTNSYQIILPLMFVCIISTVTSRLWRGDSMHIEALRRRGVILPRGPEASVMQTLHVSDVMHEQVDRVRVNDTFPVVVDHFLNSRYNNLYVVDEGDRFLGAIPLHALKEMLTQGENLSSVIAVDLLDETFTFVTPADRLADTMDKFWQQNSERLPVVRDAGTRQLLGWISKRDLIGIYNQEILQKQQVLGRFSTGEDSGRREQYVELPTGFQLQTVLVPAALEGQTISEVAPRARHSVHVLAVHRGGGVSGREPVEMPGPGTRLHTGDKLVIIGAVEDIAAFISALATTVAKPGS